MIKILIMQKVLQKKSGERFIKKNLKTKGKIVSN